MKTTLKTLLAVAVFSTSGYTLAADNHPNHLPPQEAVDACKDKKENDACSFTGKMKETIEGSCMKGPQAEHPLACVPKNHHEHH